jgi:hypothetical protein
MLELIVKFVVAIALVVAFCVWLAEQFHAPALLFIIVGLGIAWVPLVERLPTVGRSRLISKAPANAGSRISYNNRENADISERLSRAAKQFIFCLAEAAKLQ